MKEMIEPKIVVELEHNYPTGPFYFFLAEPHQAPPFGFGQNNAVFYNCCSGIKTMIALDLNLWSHFKS